MSTISTPSTHLEDTRRVSAKCLPSVCQVRFSTKHFANLFQKLFYYDSKCVINIEFDVIFLKVEQLNQKLDQHATKIIGQVRKRLGEAMVGSLAS